MSHIPSLARWLTRLGLIVALVSGVPARAGGPDAGKAPSAADGGVAAKPGPPAPPKLPFEDEIAAFERADQEKKPKRRVAPIVFTGSSSIRLWESLAKDFPRHTVLNRGFGGSHIADAVRYAGRILVAHKPPLVVLYAGTNDINAGKSPTTVANDFKAFVARVHEALPETEIAFISIGPSPSRWTQVAKVRDANRQIAAACAADPKLHFIDVFPDMIGEDGRPKPDIYLPDQLHMNRKGYELWIPHIEATLDKVVPPARGAKPKVSGRRARPSEIQTRP